MQEQYTSESTTRAAQFRFLTVAIGFTWFSALEWMIARPRAGAIAAAALTILYTLWFTRWRTNSLSKYALPLGALIICMTTMGGISYVPPGASQHYIAITAGFLLGLQVQQSMESFAQGIHGRVSMLIMSVCVWLGYIALLSAGIFSSVDWWWLTPTAGLLLAAAAMVTWTEAGASFRIFRRALPMIAILGAEMFIAVWWLPTSVLVGGLVATVSLMLFLQLCRHIWLNTWQAVRGRRYVAVGTILIVLSLLTARWN